MSQLGEDLLGSALTLVHASAAAYKQSPERYAPWASLGMDRVATFPMVEYSADKHLGSTFGLVASNVTDLVVAFRGTDDVFDLAVNLTASQEPNLDYYAGAVHKGFAQALDGIWLEFRELLDDLHIDGQRIWVTGHSLGGALATLTAKRLHSFMSPVRCMTFGQPRVGDPAFTQNYAVQHDRFVNEQDLVPKLPPRGIFTRYWHVGNEHRLDEAGNHTDGEGDTSLLEDIFFGRLANSFNLGDANNERFLEDLIKQGMQDHRLQTYVKRIEDLQSG